MNLNLMDTPEYYQISDIDRLVIKPIKKQLSPYFVGLKVKKIKSNKRGNPVLGYEFTWQKEVTEAYDPNKYDKPKAIAKKPSKKAAKKSNNPKWSNPDYVNETTEEQKAELERKKQELLERLDKSKSSEPDVVPGQTDIYDFLDEEENEVN